jgi:RHS repeat-associated protein
MLAPAEPPSHRPTPLPALSLSDVSLGPVVMADDPCEAASPAADLTGPRKYYRARYYDPNLGRFLSEDPLPDPGFSLYAYVHNDPVGSIDPSGEKEICVHASSVYWTPYHQEAKHHIWPLRGVDPNGDVESYFNLIYFSGGCAFSLPRNAHLKNPPPNLPYTIYPETTGINTVVWKVSVQTRWILRHGGQSGFRNLGAELELCYECCN